MNGETVSRESDVGSRAERDPTDGRPQRPGSTAARELSQPEIFDVLCSQRRRFLVHYLLRNEGAGTLKEAATVVGAWENHTAPEELDPKLRTRAYATLRQTHLPKMDDYGVLTFDDDSGRIELSPTGAQLQEYLESRPGDDGNWWAYYLGVGILGAILGVLASGPFIADVPGPSAALITGGAVAGLALAQFVSTAANRRPSDEIPEGQ
jgi:hypothetical protein